MLELQWGKGDCLRISRENHPEGEDGVGGQQEGRVLMDEMGCLGKSGREEGWWDMAKNKNQIPPLQVRKVSELSTEKI